MNVLTDIACMESECRKALTMVKAIGPCWYFECKACGSKCVEVQGIDGIHRWTKDTDGLYVTRSNYKAEAPGFQVSEV